jgi:2-methylcitrate dehydratase PrpD
MHGKVVLEHFEGQAFLDPQTRSTMQRVKVAPYTTDQFDFDNAYGAEVKVTLCDGRVYSAKLDGPLGQSAANPLPVATLKLKFASCARRILAGERVLELQNAVEHLEELSNVRKLTLLMASSPTTSVV